MRGILAAVLVCLFTATADADQRIEISHRTREAGALPPVELRHGERLTIVITETSRACFEFNALALEEPTSKGTRGDAADVRFEIVHDGQTAAYEVRATKRTDPACADVGLDSKAWQVPVRSSWRIASSGSLVATGLVPREFYLEPGSGVLPDGSTADGFYVRRDEDAEDALDAAGAVMVHVFSTAQSWALFVPITLGVSVDLEDPTLMLGTGLRFGRAFVTAGVAAGSRNRLPTGLRADDFTTRADALSNLGHTDSTATPEHNQRLSERRAAAVKAYLTGVGIDGARLTAPGHGAGNPVAPNDTPTGRAQNRRVELVKS